MKYAKTMAACVVVAWGCQGGASAPGYSTDPQTANLPDPVASSAPAFAAACCTRSGCEELTPDACVAGGGWSQVEPICSSVDCAVRVATGVTGGGEEGGDDESWGACCVAEQGLCAEAGQEECGEEGGSFFEEQECADACPELELFEPDENDEPGENNAPGDGVCCVASANACFGTDLDYCVSELGGTTGPSCEEACPTLEDQSTAEAACCFEGAECEDLAPALCALDGGQSVAGAACGPAACGQ